MQASDFLFIYKRMRVIISSELDHHIIVGSGTSSVGTYLYLEQSILSHVGGCYISQILKANP